MAGFIYIMSNPSFSDGLVKIGKSDRDPEEFRKSELESTGVPAPFRVEYYAFVDNHHALERELHATFAEMRPNPQREFFRVSPTEAVGRIRAVATVIFEKVNFDEKAAGPTVSFGDGHLYSGGLEDGQFRGPGSIQYVNGDTFVGQFEKGVRSGRGHLVCADGTEYQGSFADDLFEGEGVLRYRNGDVYEGSFHKGLRSGQGCLKYSDGKVYWGTFRNDVFDGTGTLSCPDGTRYEGSYSNGVRSGIGHLIEPNGAEYRGNFEQDLFEGKGMHRSRNGDKYVGFFQRGLRCGEGQLERSDGRILSGYFINDAYLGVSPLQGQNQHSSTAPLEPKVTSGHPGFGLSAGWGRTGRE